MCVLFRKYKTKDLQKLIKQNKQTNKENKRKRNEGMWTGHLVYLLSPIKDWTCLIPCSQKPSVMETLQVYCTVSFTASFDK